MSASSTQQHARRLGLARVVAIMPWWNAPSVRVTWQKADYTLAGTVGRWTLGPASYHFTTGDVRLDNADGISMRPRKGGDRAALADEVGRRFTPPGA